MAVVEINRNEQYVDLVTLARGNFFLSNGNLYLIIDSTFTDDYRCMNLSDCNNIYAYNAEETKVLAVRDDKVKIKVEI